MSPRNSHHFADYSDAETTVNTAAVVLAAGNSTRMGFEKLEASLCGKPILTHTVLNFEKNKNIKQIIVVVRQEKTEYWRTQFKIEGFNKISHIVAGGSKRQESAAVGARLIADDIDFICIHDGARPLVKQTTIDETIKLAVQNGAAAACIESVDTIKEAKNGFVTRTLDRANLFCVQTPQVFRRDIYFEALKRCKDLNCTDDSQMVGLIGHPVALSKGSNTNIKITYPSDIDLARLYSCKDGGLGITIGQGYDVHRLSQNRKLVLGGVNISHHKGLLGNSDADVLLHAIIDALLGGAALGDIGQAFPDHDIQYKGISSRILLRLTVDRLRSNGFRISNIDAVIIAQSPKLSDYMGRMKKNIADDCKINECQINIKATTEEGLGVTGDGLGMAAQAICMLYKDYQIQN